MKIQLLKCLQKQATDNLICKQFVTHKYFRTIINNRVYESDYVSIFDNAEVFKENFLKKVILKECQNIKSLNKNKNGYFLIY